MAQGLTEQMYEHIRRNNPYAVSYIMLHDIYQQYERDDIQVPEMYLLFNNRPGLDQRRYNPLFSTTSEVCIILEISHLNSAGVPSLSVKQTELMELNHGCISR